MRLFLKEILSGKDNQTADVGRAFIFMVMCCAPLIMLWGMILETWHVWVSPDHSFDLQSFFQAISTFLLGLGAFILSGAASLKLKETTEPKADPDTGTVTEVTRSTETVTATAKG